MHCAQGHLRAVSSGAAATSAATILRAVTRLCSRPQKAAEHLSACGVTERLCVQAGVHVLYVLQWWLHLELHSRGLGVNMRSALLCICVRFWWGTGWIPAQQ